MVVLEAFREGAPIIARHLGPFPEIVAQSRGGLLFKTQDELGDCMDHLASDDELRSTLGNAGRRAFQDTWSEAVVLQRYFGLIDRISRERDFDRIDEDPATESSR